MSENSDLDPRGLIREAYRIEGIGASQCRSVFMDWALGLPAGQDTQQALKALLARYEPQAPDHPMSEIMRQGLITMATPKRRGGWRSRPRD